jgi:hypothetical protein
MVVNKETDAKKNTRDSTKTDGVLNEREFFQTSTVTAEPLLSSKQRDDVMSKSEMLMVEARSNADEE